MFQKSIWIWIAPTSESNTFQIKIIIYNNSISLPIINDTCIIDHTPSYFLYFWKYKKRKQKKYNFINFSKVQKIWRSKFNNKYIINYSY